MNRDLTVDVLLIGYNRPELVQKRLNEIAKLNLDRLHVSIDGSTLENNREHGRILQEISGRLSNKVDYSYNVHRSNLGLTPHVTRAISEFLEKSQNAIIIEDDISFNEQTLTSLIYGLQELKRIKKNGTVGAFSPLRFPERLARHNRFVESNYFLCWGWAVSRETWREYQANLKMKDIESALTVSETWRSLNEKQKKIWTSRFEKVSGDPKFTWDFQMQFATFRNDMIHLLPLASLAVNEGFSDPRATHTSNDKPRWMRNKKLSSHQVTGLTKSRILTRAYNLILGLTVVGDHPIWIRQFSRFVRKTIKKLLQRLNKPPQSSDMSNY